MKQSVANTIWSLFLSGMMIVPAWGQTTEVVSYWMGKQNKGQTERLKNENMVPLAQVLSAIEKTHNISFVYEDRYLEDKFVDAGLLLNMNPDELAEVLSNTLAELGFTWSREGFTTWVIKPDESEAQPGSLLQERVTGYVFDAETGEALPGVTVLIVGNDRGTATDPDGFFELSVPSSDEPVLLRFSYIGYQSLEMPADGRAGLDVALERMTLLGDEVVVIGYGEQRRADLTGSISSVKAEDLEAAAVSSLDQALQGRVAGVHIVSASGAPGAGTIVRIRGNNSVQGNNDPLFVVDGVPIRSGGSLMGINFDDVESVDVLKDASATAIYGSRGSNGVILITTKRGSRDFHSIEYESYVGFQEVIKKLDILNSRDFAEIANERAVNDGAPLPFPDLNALPNVETDWQDAIFQRAMMQNHQLRISGGSERTRYLVSGNLLDQDGIIIGSDFTRGSLRVNLDQDVSSKFRVSPRLFMSRSVTNTVPVVGDQSVIFSGLTAPPFVPVRDEHGNYTSADVIKGFPFSPGSGQNPVAVAMEELNRTTTSRVLGNVSARYEPADGLAAQILLGVEYANNEEDVYLPRTVEGGQPAGSGSKSRTSGITYLNENTLTYNRSFNADHRVNTTAGFTWEQGETEWFSASARGFVTDDLQNNNLGAGEDYSAPSSGIEDWTLVSWLGRMNYAFRDRYLFTLSGRADGDSRFGEGNQWAFFPSAAFAWVLSEEEFFKRNAGAFSELKFRLSWGISGNQPLGPYQSLPRMNPGQLSMGGGTTVGFFPATVGNPDLKWERTEEVNVGVDIGLWDYRLRLTADYYYKETSDLLAVVNLPPSSGFGQSLQNIGSTQNQGVEFEVGAELIRGTTFAWDVNANLYTNRNKVTELAGGADIVVESANILGPANIVREGEPLSSFYGLREDGLTEEGLINYVDQNGDGVINDDDRVILGNPYPDFIYGFSTDLHYGNFHLSVFIQGEAGKQLWNTNLYNHATSFYRGNNQLAAVQDRWTPDNPNPNADYPKATVNLNTTPSDRYVEDASYLRLKNVRLTYTVPVERLNLPLRSAGIYVSGQNLITLTGYSWYDPDINSFSSGDLRIGVDKHSYPAARVVSMGIQVGF